MNGPLAVSDIYVNGSIYANQLSGVVSLSLPLMRLITVHQTDWFAALSLPALSASNQRWANELNEG